MLKVGFYLSLILVVVLLWKKKKSKPTSLKLKAYKEHKTGLPGLRKVSAEVVEPGYEDQEGEVAFSDRSNKDNPGGLFIFRGDRYLAYDLLQVPRGAEEKELKKAFSKKVQSEPGKKALYFKAYETLIKELAKD